MVYETGMELLKEIFLGLELFNNGALLSVIFIVFTILLITRDLSKWSEVGLSVTLLYVTVLQTVYNGMWGALLIIITGIIYVMTVVYPNMPKDIGVHIKEGIQGAVGIGRFKELDMLHRQRNEMRKAKNLEEIDAEIRRKGSGYALRQDLELTAFKEKTKNKEKIKLAQAVKNKRLFGELGLDKIQSNKTLLTGAQKSKIAQLELAEMKKKHAEKVRERARNYKQANIIMAKLTKRDKDSEAHFWAMPKSKAKEQNLRLRTQLNPKKYKGYKK